MFVITHKYKNTIYFNLFLNTLFFIKSLCFVWKVLVKECLSNYNEYLYFLFYILLLYLYFILNLCEKKTLFLLILATYLYNCKIIVFIK